MTTAPAFTRDGNCVTADARNNTPAGTATITDWQVQEAGIQVVMITGDRLETEIGRASCRERV